MTARDEAIKAAAKAWFHGGPLGVQLDRSDIERLLAAAVPVLLNDIADRIDKATEFGLAEYNCGVRDAAELVRVAAEGWGA